MTRIGLSLALMCVLGSSALAEQRLPPPPQKSRPLEKISPRPVQPEEPSTPPASAPTATQKK